jgi:hypothetical protein
MSASIQDVEGKCVIMQMILETNTKYMLTQLIFFHIKNTMRFSSMISYNKKDLCIYFRFQ